MNCDQYFEVGTTALLGKGFQWLSSAGGSTSGTSAARFAIRLSKFNIHFSVCSSDWKRAESKNPTG